MDVSTLFDTFREFGLRPCVIRNYDQLPHDVGNDLDIVVDKPEYSLTKRALLDFAAREGMRLYMHERRQFVWEFRLVGDRTNVPRHLKVDVIPEGQGWWGALYLTHAEIIQSSNPVQSWLIPRPAHEAAMSLFTHLLWGGFYKHKYIHLLPELIAADRLEFTRILRQRFGSKWLRITDWIETKNVAALEDQASSLRRSLWLRALRTDPIGSIARFARFALGEVMRRATRTGIVISIVGPDGVGKSTVIGLLEPLIEKNLPGTQVSVRHWRPSLLPSLSSLVSRQTKDGFGAGPKQAPGVFQPLRLLYYLLDFHVGALLKDRLAGPSPRVILYDRSALDMAVDPLRYGMKSPMGGRTISRLSPKPHAVIVLYDSPQAIRRRKQELSIGELQRQLEEWLELAEQRAVHAIVPATGTPDHVAELIWDLVVRTVADEAPSEPSLAGEWAEWLTQIIRSGEIRDPSDPAQFQSLDRVGGRLKDCDFAVVPLGRGRGVLAPLRPRRLAARSMELYRPQRVVGKLLKTILRTGLQVGAIQCFTRCIRLRAGPVTGKTPQGQGHILRYLSSLLDGDRRLHFAISVGAPGPLRKSTVQVMDEVGRVLAFVKIGHSTVTKELLWNEAATLKSIAGKLPRNVRVPEVIDTGTWRGLRVLAITNVLEQEFATRFIAPKLPANETVVEAHRSIVRSMESVRRPLGEAAYTRNLYEQLSDITHSAYNRSLMLWALDTVVQVWGDQKVSFGFNHGDWTPWNIAIGESTNSVSVWDFEFARTAAPIGMDWIHLQLQVRTLVKGHDLVEAIADMLKERATILPEVEPYCQQPIRPLMMLYLVESLLKQLKYEGVGIESKMPTRGSKLALGIAIATSRVVLDRDR